MILDLYGIPIEVNSRIIDNNKIVEVLPFPEEKIRYEESLKVLDKESLQLLWSKHYFGINQRTQLFKVLYDTYTDKAQNLQNINDFLTVQALFCDMVLRLGTILEDFAGFATACWEYSIHKKSIAQVFLAFSNPMGFYNGMGKRFIKQIYRLPESKFNLDRIFRDLTEKERDLIWSSVQVTVEIIEAKLIDISKAIVRNENESMTLYDMYNKLKHGFAPIYPFMLPEQQKITIDDVNVDEFELVYHTALESVTIMHDKHSGQRTNDEQNLFDKQHLASPTYTRIVTNIETSKDISAIIQDIDFLYHRLVNTYLKHSQGRKLLGLLADKNRVTTEETIIIEKVLLDPERYL